MKIKDKINIKFNIPDKDVIITPIYKKQISNIVNSKTGIGMCFIILIIILLISTNLYLIIITRKDYILIVSNVDINKIHCYNTPLKRGFFNNFRLNKKELVV